MCALYFLGRLLSMELFEINRFFFEPPVRLRSGQATNTKHTKERLYPRESRIKGSFFETRRTRRTRRKDLRGYFGTTNRHQ